MLGCWPDLGYRSQELACLRVNLFAPGPILPERLSVMSLLALFFHSPGGPLRAGKTFTARSGLTLTGCALGTRPRSAIGLRVSGSRLMSLVLSILVFSL